MRSASPARLIACSMVWPSTKCRPSTRIAWSSAWRRTGSPRRCSSRVSHAPGSASCSRFARTTRPVSISPQVDALTRSEPLRPRWRDHSPALSLSRISRSAVSASGIRSNASARHISMMPSRVLSWYSCRNASTPSWSPPARRTRPASSSARARMRALVRSSTAASSSSSATQAASSARWASRILSRRGSSLSAGRSSRKRAAMSRYLAGPRRRPGAAAFRSDAALVS